MLKRTFLSVSLVALLFGCATTRKSKTIETSGFLSDYSILSEGAKDEAQLIYINPEADFSAYDKIFIEPFTVRVSEDSGFDTMSDEELLGLITHLHAAIYEQLSQDYMIVDRAGPGVMKLRAALTEAQGSKVVLGTISAAIPTTRSIGTISQLSADTHVLVGRAAIEGELRDAQTGQLLIAAVDRRAGTHVLKGTTKTWSDVEESYDYWAERLRERLHELRTGGASE